MNRVIDGFCRLLDWTIALIPARLRQGQRMHFHDAKPLLRKPHTWATHGDVGAWHGGDRRRRYDLGRSRKDKLVLAHFEGPHQRTQTAIRHRVELGKSFSGARFDDEHAISLLENPGVVTR